MQHSTTHSFAIEKVNDLPDISVVAQKILDLILENDLPIDFKANKTIFDDDVVGQADIQV